MAAKISLLSIAIILYVVWYVVAKNFRKGGRLLVVIAQYVQFLSILTDYILAMVASARL